MTFPMSLTTITKDEVTKLSEIKNSVLASI